METARADTSHRVQNRSTGRYPELVATYVGMNLLSLTLFSPHLPAQEATGLRGDSAAIADAEAMVETMGGRAIWLELESVHFVHEWDIFNRPDIYLENEILDLTGPRSYVTMESEIYHRIRAYSPEHGYWNIVNGKFSYASDEALASAMERAPYSIYRLARAIARGDSTFHVQFGPMKDVPGATGLEFRGPDNAIHGWILLNTRKEPVVWATTQYAYAFGPMRRFGNLRVPDWAVTGGGRVRYEMVSLTGSTEPPDPSLFAPPPEHQDAGGDEAGVLAETIRAEFAGFESGLRYFEAYYDLDRDGRDEVIVYVVGPGLCGTGGCNTLIFKANDTTYDLVSSIPITRLPILVLPEFTSGWRDLAVSVSGGGVQPGYLARLRFDGTHYPPNPTVEPAEPMDEQPDGAVLLLEPFASLEDGKKLDGSQ